MRVRSTGFDDPAVAVSVVPKERAGMATGIFFTVRLAGEGVALAAVSAILAMLVAGRIGTAGLSGSARSAGQHLAGALAALPGAESAKLVVLYGDAFGWLLTLLAGITATTAVIVFLSLGKDKVTACESHDHPSVVDSIAARSGVSA